MGQAKQIAWDSALATGGALLVGFVAIKIFGQHLGVPMSMNGVIMFAMAIFLGNLVVNWLQKEKYIQADI